VYRIDDAVRVYRIDGTVRVYRCAKKEIDTKKKLTNENDRAMLSTKH